MAARHGIILLNAANKVKTAHAHMTKNKKLFAWGAVVLLFIVLSGLWLFPRYQAIKNQEITKRKAEMIALINDHASQVLSKDVFAMTDKNAQAQAFNDFWRAVQSPEIVRMKAWDKQSTIVWSNLPEIIGQRFPENEEVKEALDGEVAFEYKASTFKSEVASEREYVNLVEIYVPFHDADNNVSGVLELYRSSVNLPIRAAFWPQALLGEGVLALVFAIIAVMRAALLRRLHNARRRDVGEAR